MTNQSEPVSSKVTYRRLLSYTFQHKGVFAFSVVSMMLVALTQPAFAALMQPMLDGGFVNQDPEVIKWLPVGIISIFLVRAVTSFCSDYGMSWIGRGVIQTMRAEMFYRLLILPNKYYDNTSTGETISRFTFDVEQLATAATTAITIMIKDGLMIISLIGWMFYISPKLATVFLVLGPVLALIVSIVSRRFRNISRRIQNSMGSITHVLEETVQAQRVVKIFGGHEYEQKRFDQNNNKNRQQNMKLMVSTSLSTSTLQFIVSFALAGIVHIAIQEGLEGKLTVGTFTAFIVSMSMLFQPLKRITNINATIQKGVAAAESVFKFLDTLPESDSGTYEPEKIKGEIIIEHLNFAYDNHPDKLVLNDINLQIKSGETVAFVGRSGSGKSTLVNLIPRLYDGYAGKILLDGESINHYKISNLRKHIAYVGQEIVLFNDTIEHNIAYGCSDVTLDEVVQAAKSANAFDFIERLPKGMQSLAGEKGVLLSGGQRQRLAIARALLKNSPVLIMDEATSALDTESEKFIQSALEVLTKNRTTLVVAHRLSTIQNADKIVVMDDGKIIETGTHKELIAKGGAYSALHNVQFSETENNSTE
ncbi:Lipid A export permease/ATP-binding protein MsbA [hydrothermal vent metagenome]|uniref:Lipid A export permease/ATP-binding protein MsbA n=1 Tax=hydrothermal vent metagenome TaxID=652676 RepID=A0A3B0XJE2_9ZZZZ